MKRLRINGIPILNMLDLKNKFLPLALYQELNTFEGFAAVHCVPLPLQLMSQEEEIRYNAKCLTKEFWHRLLCRIDWPGGTRSECLDSVLKQELDRLADGNQGERSALADRLEREVADAALAEKLDWIQTAAKTDFWQTMLLLAICELAEVDPRKTAAGDWRRPDAVSNGSAEKQSAAELFTYEGTVYLTAGSRVYKYWCYDDKKLEQGALIQTVRIEAKECDNQYAVVRIELYNRAAGKCLQSLTLNSGEFRYCTVCKGRIIRFLPCISVSDDLCLSRSDYHSEEIRVRPKNGEAWSLDAERVSCFSAGSKDAGFLLVQDGRVNASFYKAAQDYITRLQLEMLVKPVVEARIWEEGYELLLEDGTTVTNFTSGNRTGVVTLDVPPPSPVGMSGLREVALSQTRQSAALLMAENDKERVFFFGAGDTFQLMEDGTIMFKNYSEDGL